MHTGNSCQPLDHLFALCDPVTLTFDLILIVNQRPVMDYPCDKFGDIIFSRFGFIVWANRHAHIHTHTSEWFTPATFINVSKD